LLHGPSFDFLSPQEFLIWRAYYSLEPYSNELKQLVNIEGAVGRVKDITKLLPPECELDQPLEDMNQDKMKENLVWQMTMMAADYLPDLKAAIEQAREKGELHG
jgi:hypothetical protein